MTQFRRFRHIDVSTYRRISTNEGDTDHHAKVSSGRGCRGHHQCGPFAGRSCSEGKGSSEGSGEANAATKGVVNASDAKGGTVTYALSDAPESFDPGNTYYAFIYNFNAALRAPAHHLQAGPRRQGQ